MIVVPWIRQSLPASLLAVAAATAVAQSLSLESNTGNIPNLRRCWSSAIPP
jgi:MFS superfamily sulfate permease-like transporter